MPHINRQDNLRALLTGETVGRAFLAEFPYVVMKAQNRTSQVYRL